MTVALLGTVHDAAVALQYSQSGVSRQLRTLEGKLGVQLFRRDGGRLNLTRPAKEILPLAESILALSDALKGSAHRNREPQHSRAYHGP